ncbi:MAG: DUF6168 family protein [Lutibacter sp.]
MSSSKSSIIAFSIRLIFFMVLLFVIHISILSYLNLPKFNNQIILAYLINSFLAIGIYSLLYVLKDGFEQILGFIFLGGSFLKIIVFFVLFYGSYKQDGVITNPERFSFLSPYFLSLFLETFYLVKLMKTK